MILTCDIGNTLTKFGLFENGELTETFRAPFSDIGTGLLNGKVPGASVITSVVPAKTENLINLLKQKFGHEPVVINRDSRFNLRPDYDTPETLGMDRICGAEGAFAEFTGKRDFRQNDIIVSADMGTATTVNVILYPGVFSGGIIAPGIKLLSSVLHEKTAMLPETDTADYKGIIGKSTTGSIASGIVNMTTGLFYNVINGLKQKHPGADIHFYITGGNAEKLLPYLEFPFKYDPDLVIKGLYALYDINRK